MPITSIPVFRISFIIGSVVKAIKWGVKLITLEIQNGIARNVTQKYGQIVTMKNLIIKNKEKQAKDYKKFRGDKE